MANTTDVMAKSVHGTNPQNMVEYIIRQKIYDSVYWKAECFGLTAELLVDKGTVLRYAGGMYGEPQRPSEFLCLILKMLQIQPDKDIIVEFIKDDAFKYLRLLGAFYMRLVGRPVDVYQYLEPLYNDFRKVRVRESKGAFALSYVDQVVDDMLTRDYCFDIALPRLPARKVLEEAGQLQPRVSVLDEEFDEQALAEEQAEAAAAATSAAAALKLQESAALETATPTEPAAPADAVRARDGEASIGPAAGGEQRRDRPRDPSPWRLSKKERKADRERRRSRTRSPSRDRRRRDDHSPSREGRGGPWGAREARGRSRSPRSRHSVDQGRRERRGRDSRSRSPTPRSRSRDRHRERHRRERRSPDPRDTREWERREERRRRDRRRDSPSPPHHVKKSRGGAEAAGLDAEVAEANALRASLGLKPLA
ncbi:hypothetical protein ACKKBF_B38735 [Auxenochlorella protothecoides x Auxenochlorella symbiontica]